MALIVKCRSCRQRMPEDATVCPACSSSNVRFIVDYWPDGRRGGRKQITLPKAIQTAIEAREYEQALVKAAGKQRKPRAIDTSDVTVNDLFDDYLDYYKLHRSPNSYRDLSSVYNHSIDRILGKVRIRDLNGGHVLLYQKTRKMDQITRNGAIVPVSNRTINKEMDLFSGFLKWCRDKKHQEIPSIQIDKLKCSRPDPIVLSPKEVGQILRAADPFHRTFFLCLYSLGLRLSEVRFMTWSGVDFVNGTIRVRQKGGSDKILPMNALLKKELRALQKGRAKDAKESDLVFVSRRTGGAVNNVRKALARACKIAGCEKRVYAHLFRHSVATHFMGSGVNMRTIQQYLGHSNISTTEWYTHVNMDHMRTAADDVFKGGIYGKKSNIRIVATNKAPTN